MKLFFPLLALSLVLASSCTEPGPAVSPNGYRYEFRNDVSGPTVQPGEVGKLHVSAYKADSLLFSSREQASEPRGLVLPRDESARSGPNAIFYDALVLMSPGDSLSIYDPLDSIERLPPGFVRGDELRYDLTLVSVIDSATFAAEEQARVDEQRARAEAYSKRGDAVADSVATVLAEYKRNPTAAGFTTTSSGLKYKILEPGTGPVPPTGMPVLVSYYGVLVRNGEMFDNSFRGGRPFDFPLGQGAVIQGWDEGIALMREGTRAVLAIPSDLGYGDSPRPGGPIGPGDELFFYVDVEKAVSGS